jgi:hypothetical protein
MLRELPPLRRTIVISFLALLPTPVWAQGYGGYPGGYGGAAYPAPGAYPQGYAYSPAAYQQAYAQNPQAYAQNPQSYAQAQAAYAYAYSQYQAAAYANAQRAYGYGVNPYGYAPSSNPGYSYADPVSPSVPAASTPDASATPTVTAQPVGRHGSEPARATPEAPLIEGAVIDNAYSAPVAPPVPVAPPAHASTAAADDAPGFFGRWTDWFAARGAERDAARLGGYEDSTWIRVDGLAWWLKPQTITVPLVTTGDSSTIGALNEPGTKVLLGPGQNLDNSAHGGLRATIGTWFCSDSHIGVEVSAFAIESRSATFAAGSEGGTFPIVSIPFNATDPFGFNPVGETSLNAGGAANRVVVSVNSRLWGGEANLMLRGADGNSSRCSFLLGVRYLCLEEGLGISDTFFDPATAGTLGVQDRFNTRNDFLGAQIGTRFEWGGDCLSLITTLKTAIGTNDESVNIQGNTSVTNGAFGFPSGTTPGGVFAQPSNIGSHRQDEFAVVPQADVEIAVRLNSHLRLLAGYEFLYVSDVLRPTDQVNRNINPTQNAIFGGTGGVVAGSSNPVAAVHSTDFWAHGVHIGAEFRW